MCKLIIKTVFLGAALMLTQKVKSQSSKLGTWQVLNVEYYFNKKLNLWGEGQLRSQKILGDFYYHELKGGINYKFSESMALLAGAGQYGTYSIGGNFRSPVITHEFRLWEQLTLTNNINRLKIEHRYRIEQRWINDNYRNRFRYRLNPILPINKREIEKGTLFASVYDEIFLTNKAPFFERNRFFLGLGFIISRPFSFQLGWIRQFDYSLSNPGSKKDFLQTSFFFRLHRGKFLPPPHPSPMD